jgi:hypothetical protein
MASFTRSLSIMPFRKRLWINSSFVAPELRQAMVVKLDFLVASTPRERKCLNSVEMVTVVREEFAIEGL